MRCDFSNDCDDGSDENISECEKMPIVENECDNENFLHCKYSRKCIPKEWLCDMEHDCGLIGKFNLLDQSDEESTLNCSKKCPNNHLPCSNGICLHISKFCDGRVDCENDELVCNDNSPCKTLKCAYDCKVTPFGPKCYCPPNQDIVNDTKCVLQKTCNENEFDSESCDQLCILLKGKNKCTCTTGYERTNQKCIGINCKLIPNIIKVILCNRKIIIYKFIQILRKLLLYYLFLHPRKFLKSLYRLIRIILIVKMLLLLY